MSDLFISKFTPSIMDKNQLRMMFVQREKLLDDILEGLSNSISTKQKHHYLLVGPRGIGKTHIVSLVYHDLLERCDFNQTFLLAWLREEEWGVSSYLDFLVRILRSLEDTACDESISAALDLLKEVRIDKAESVASDIVQKFLKQKTMVIIVENLNMIFKGMSELEQKKLRSLFQETGRIAILATSTSLFSGIQLRKSPFYGFFEIHHLNELSIQEAEILILKIARMTKNEKVVEFLNTAEGKARVKVIYHLAGGNHRVYVILCQFLNLESIDQLVGIFLEVLDDLTPYYQSQLFALSQQQRKIVEFMCESKYAVPVKEIAAACFMTPQTASSQLMDLKENRFVSWIKVGRETWYELKEPLLRLCLETKRNTSRPIEILVELLRVWYSSDQLAQMKEHTSAKSILTHQYFDAAWNSKSNIVKQKNVSKKQQKRIEELELLLSESLRSNDLKAAEKIFHKIALERGEALDWQNYAFSLALQERNLNALDAMERALKIDPKLSEAKEQKLVILINLGRYDEVLQQTGRWLKIEPDNPTALDFRASILSLRSLLDEALEIFEKLSKMEPNNPEYLVKKAGVLMKLRNFDDAEIVLNKALKLKTKSITAYSFKGFIAGLRNRNQEAVEFFSKALKISDRDETIWIGMCMSKLNLGRYEEALNAAESAMETNKNSLNAHFYRALCLFCLQRWGEYKREFIAVLKRSEKTNSPIGDFGAIFRFLIKVPFLKPLWEEKSKEIFELCESHSALIQLSSGLSRSIPALVSDEVSTTAAKKWVQLWKDIVINLSEFETSIRLLDVALVYKETKNLEDSYTLLSEERKLFDELIDEANLYDSES